MDKLLFPLTEWNERTATRGRGSGNLIRERFVVAMDNRTFILGTQTKNESSNIIGFKFASKIHQFITMASYESGTDKRKIFDDLMNKINDGSFVYDDNKSFNDNLLNADMTINPFGLYPGKDYVG